MKLKTVWHWKGVTCFAVGLVIVALVYTLINHWWLHLEGITGMLAGFCIGFVYSQLSMLCYRFWHLEWRDDDGN